MEEGSFRSDEETDQRPRGRLCSVGRRKCEETEKAPARCPYGAQRKCDSGRISAVGGRRIVFLGTSRHVKVSNWNPLRLGIFLGKSVFHARFQSQLHVGYRR